MGIGVFVVLIVCACVLGNHLSKTSKKKNSGVRYYPYTKSDGTSGVHAPAIWATRCTDKKG